MLMDMDYFQFGATMNKTAMNVGVQVFVRTYFRSLGYIPRNEVTGSYGKQVYVDLFKKLPNFFPK